MRPQTLSDIAATQDILAMVKKRITKHADDFMKDQALDNLTVAQKLLDDAGKLLGQAATIEDLPTVLRTSLRVLKESARG